MSNVKRSKLKEWEAEYIGGEFMYYNETRDTFFFSNRIFLTDEDIDYQIERLKK